MVSMKAAASAIFKPRRCTRCFPTEQLVTGGRRCRWKSDSTPFTSITDAGDRRRVSMSSRMWTFSWMSCGSPNRRRDAMRQHLLDDMASTV